MSYTYPQALDALQIVITDLLTASYPNTAFNVRVVADAVSGTASVDWNGTPGDPYVRVTVNMPVRKATYRMSADEFRHWAAYGLHEVGHPNDTCKATWQEAVRTQRHQLLNALEDVRIEKRTIDRGIAHNAVKVLSELIDMLHAKTVANGYNPNEPRSIGWTLSTLGRHANGYAIDISDITRNLNPNGIVGQVVPWALADLAACTSTQDCLDLADKVVAAINAAMVAQKVTEAPSEADEADEASDAADEAGAPVAPPVAEQGGMLEDRKDPEADETLADDLEGEADEAGKTAPVQGGGGGKPADEFKASDVDEVDMNPTTEGNLTSSGNEAHAQRRIIYALRHAAEQASEPGVGDRRITGRDTHGSVAYVTGNASKMGRQRQLLARALKHEEQDDFDGGRLNGRLNTKALHKLTTGGETIFGKRVLSEGYDTDLQILIDGSGSMAGTRILAATALALTAAQAASQVGVNCTAHVFNDEGLQLLTKGREKPNGKKFAYAYNQVGGSTPLTENMLLAATLQAKRANGRRRVMLVITDGGCNSGDDVVRAAATYLERAMGVELANLHIGPKVMGLFRNEVAVKVDQVSETGLNQLTAVMGRGA